VLPDSPASFRFGRSLILWLQESRRRIGGWPTLRQLSLNFCELLRDCAPAHRRLRYGDLEYDWQERVDTTWSNVPLATRLREIVVGRQYQPSDPDLFREVLGGLSIPYEQFTFVDLGSGKGRALLLATEFPFHRIVGVELLPELHAVAGQNARQFRAGAQQDRIELWCGDAREFVFPCEPLVVFLFDPFPEYVLEKVIANLGESALQNPRPIVLVYLNPLSEHVRSGSGWLRRVRGNIQYAVYENGYPTSTKP
jgi:SAM-dependent methyltransferase